MAFRFKPPVILLWSSQLEVLQWEGIKPPQTTQLPPQVLWLGGPKGLLALVVSPQFPGWHLAEVSSYSKDLLVSWGEFRLSQVCGQTDLIVTEIIYFLLLWLFLLFFAALGLEGWCRWPQPQLSDGFASFESSGFWQEIPVHPYLEIWCHCAGQKPLELPAEGIICSVCVCNLCISSEVFISWERRFSRGAQAQAGFAVHTACPGEAPGLLLPELLSCSLPMGRAPGNLVGTGCVHWNPLWGWGAQGNLAAWKESPVCQESGITEGREPGTRHVFPTKTPPQQKSKILLSTAWWFCSRQNPTPSFATLPTNLWLYGM